MIEHPGWQNENASRPYPLRDNVTLRDDTGLALPHDILVECRISYPVRDQSTAYLSAIALLPKIVTAAFVLDTPGGQIPIGVVSVPRPIIPYKLYALTAFAAGVGGWVSFGPGVTNASVVRKWAFSTTAQSALVPAACMPYESRPVTSLGRRGSQLRLEGVVTLRGGQDVVVAKARRVIDGVERDCITVGLNEEGFTLSRLREFIGSCRGRPEGFTCRLPPIYRINSVSPDCNGNITLEFSGPTITPLQEGGGAVVESPLGLDVLCPDQISAERLFTGVDSGAYPPVAVPPTPPCVPTLYLETFDDGAAPMFTLANFELRDCQLLASGSAVSTAMLSPLVLSDCLCHTIEVDVRTPSEGSYPAANAWILAAWKDVDNYIRAGVDFSADRCTLWIVVVVDGVQYANQMPPPGSQQIDAFDNGSPLTLRLVVNDYGRSSGEKATLVDLLVSGVAPNGLAASQRVSLALQQRIDTSGGIGLYSDNSATAFDNFRIDWTDFVPPAIPCLNYGYYGGYVDTSCDCTSCGVYQLEATPTFGPTFLIQTLPPVSNVYRGYFTDGSAWVNATIELDPVACTLRVWLIISDGFVENVAVGVASAPCTGAVVFVPMEFVNMDAPFFLEVQCP